MISIGAANRCGAPMWISGGARTSLYVPLMRDRDVLGTIHIYRQEVRPFSEADFPHAEFRGPGSHRDGEHAHHYRDARRSSSRLQPPRCCRSSIPHPVTSNRSSMHCSKKRRGWAERPSVCLRFMRAGAFAPWRCGHAGGVCRIPTPQPARLRAGNITSAPSGRRTHRPYRRSKGTGPL